MRFAEPESETKDAAAEASPPPPGDRPASPVSPTPTPSQVRRSQPQAAASAAPDPRADTIAELMATWHAQHDQRMSSLERPMAQLGSDVQRLAAAVEGGRRASARKAREDTHGPSTPAPSASDWRSGTQSAL